jgi:5-bromo-4-chloroindolyl phosphate hydrolysis protein
MPLTDPGVLTDAGKSVGKVAKEIYKFVRKRPVEFFSAIEKTLAAGMDFVTGRREREAAEREKQDLEQELSDAQSLIEEIIQQLGQSSQALETAMKRVRFFKTLSWILGAIAVIACAVAGWALGKI